MPEVASVTEAPALGCDHLLGSWVQLARLSTVGRPPIEQDLSLYSLPNVPALAPPWHVPGRAELGRGGLAGARMGGTVKILIAENRHLAAGRLALVCGERLPNTVPASHLAICIRILYVEI